MYGEWFVEVHAFLHPYRFYFYRSFRKKQASSTTDRRSSKKVSEEAYYIDCFHGFAVQLVTALESLCEVSPMSGTSKTVATQREMLWKVFHEKRLTV